VSHYPFNATLFMVYGMFFLDRNFVSIFVHKNLKNRKT